MLSDTIAAIATPLGGEGGIGIIRISGPKALNIVGKTLKLSGKGRFISHTVRHGWVMDGARQIDEILAIYMTHPNSYTGEDVVEISCHGGSANLRNVLSIVIAKGARLAERGEFTKRAFLNGKLDLSQAEAVIDIIKAKTKEASVIAASHLKGALANRINVIRQELIVLLSEIEASIDFPDEIDEVTPKNSTKAVKNAIKAVDNLLKTFEMGKILREGVAIAIIGRPNVGKSSLLNALIREDRALVHKDPGTTRDTIEEVLNIKGIHARVIDTAGIRATRNSVEKMGIQKARAAYINADIVLVVVDASQPINKIDMSLLEGTRELNRIVVLNKADKKNKVSIRSLGKHDPSHKNLMVSALQGDGIPSLENAIYDLININKVVARNADVMINLRQKQCLLRAKESLERAVVSVKRKAAADCISIDIKSSIASLGEVTGDEVSDEIIDEIFERFCVGK
jgi:tRNA modification GTPase